MSEILKFENQAPRPDSEGYYIRTPRELLSAKIPERAKLLYIHLLGYCKGDKRMCWPSQALLAEETGWNERLIRIYLRQLATAGLLTIHPPNPMRSHNMYELHMLPWRITESARADPRVRQGGSFMSPGRIPESAESHVESHDHVRESDPNPVLLGDSSQNSSIPGYVALLLEVAGSRESAEKIAALIPANRDEDYVKQCIAYSKTRNNPPGWLTIVFRSNGPAPRQEPPGAARSRQKNTKGDLLCPNCNGPKRPYNKLCFGCSQKVVENEKD